jgi:hypothetical protein
MTLIKRSDLRIRRRAWTIRLLKRLTFLILVATTNAAVMGEWNASIMPGDPRVFWITASAVALAGMLVGSLVLLVVQAFDPIFRCPACRVGCADPHPARLAMATGRCPACDAVVIVDELPVPPAVPPTPEELAAREARKRRFDRPYPRRHSPASPSG